MIPLRPNYITIFPFKQHISMIFFRLVKVNEIDFKQCDAFKTHVCTQHSSNRDEKFTMNVCIPLWSDALLFCSLKALSTVARQRGKHNHTKSNELMALGNARAVQPKWLEEWSVVGFGLFDIGCSGCFSHVVCNALKDPLLLEDMVRSLLDLGGCWARNFSNSLLLIISVADGLSVGSNETSQSTNLYWKKNHQYC